MFFTMHILHPIERKKILRLNEKKKSMDIVSHHAHHIVIRNTKNDSSLWEQTFLKHTIKSYTARYKSAVYMAIPLKLSETRLAVAYKMTFGLSRKRLSIGFYFEHSGGRR